MNSYIANPLQFLISTLFQLYILAVMLRFLLQWVRADFYNPVSQFLVKITNPPLRPLRRLIPGFGGVDVAAIVLMFLLQFVALVLILAVRAGPFELAAGALAIWTVAELLDLLFNVYIFALLIQAVLSWVNPGYNPVSAILYNLNRPILRPVQRVVPPISGIDLSPLVAILGLQVLKMLVLPPIRSLAIG